jgi:hypothetical protein
VTASTIFLFSGGILQHSRELPKGMTERAPAVPSESELLRAMFPTSTRSSEFAAAGPGR